MGLTKLTEGEWLQPDPDFTARAAGFAAYPEGVQLTRDAEAPRRELAAMLGVEGSLPEAALAAHEDMCLLTQSATGEPYRLIGAAVAWPTDWHPKAKMGLPLRALHAPIAGYEEHLATGVDRFIEILAPGPIFGRCNWFIAPTDERRWIAEGEPQAQFAHVTPENAGETLFARSERQTLRRLPETGAILFTIGVYVEPLGKLTQDNLAAVVISAQTLVEEEGDRRGAPAYARSLGEFIRGRLSE